MDFFELLPGSKNGIPLYPKVAEDIKLVITSADRHVVKQMKRLHTWPIVVWAQ
jgi:hypothetical protein